jgi:hypothetical protein
MHIKGYVQLSKPQLLILNQILATWTLTSIFIGNVLHIKHSYLLYIVYCFIAHNSMPLFKHKLLEILLGTTPKNNE